IKQDDYTYELAKMAVDEAYRGKQIGKKLGLIAIERAKKLKAEKIILESNKTLTPALNLYRRLGFVNVCADHLKSLYQRANVTMELNLS
ncbi:MAG: GNAT family N-acetyltransferase, partial [Cyclobacteriaceae bacterium]